MPLTLGTAGHVDHGKTALIRALTGVETDRLPAERERGISIELGYAPLRLPSGTTLSVVDVPGHERYVRTMVAGATGIDMFLMVIAADDGVMPQTREHALILSSLGIDRGVVAITKADLADPASAAAEAAELLPGVPAVAVSSTTAMGLNDVRTALDDVAAAQSGRPVDGQPARLHVDRSFTIHGAGTVVTGTLWSGVISAGDSLLLLPSGRRVRVRAVQVHDEPVARARAGQRVAVNLTGVPRAEVSRGDVLSGGPIEPTFRLDVASGSDDDLPPRVQVHHGTRETPARVTWLGGRYHQLRLERPLIALDGDHVVIRRIAPPDTIGGALVLDADPRRHGPGRRVTEELARRERGEVPAAAQPAAGTVPAMPATVSQPAPPPVAEPEPLSESARQTEGRLREAWLTPPLDSELDADDLAALRSAGRAVRVSPSLHFHADALEEARRRVVDLAGGPGGAVTVAQVRDALGSSRKYALAVLSHLDTTRVTVRRGDEHVVRRRAAVS